MSEPPVHAEPPPESPEPQTRRPSDWLGKLVAATETVAPLVTRKIPDSKNIPDDRRSRWAALFGVISLLFAALQFLLQLFNLVTRPLAPLAKALPYIAALLLVIGIVLAGMNFLRSNSRRQKVRSLALLGVLLVVGSTWGGWLLYSIVRPPSGFLILIGEFDGQSASERIDFARRISDYLKNEMSDASFPVEVRRTLESYADANTARNRGEALQAGMVIWGWYDDLGVSPHVELLHLPGFGQPSLNIPVLFATASAASPSGLDFAAAPSLDQIDQLITTPAALPEVALFAANGPQQLAFMTSAILGMGYLANGDNGNALAMFDQALTQADPLVIKQRGQELVLHQRALLRNQSGDSAGAISDLEAALAIAPDFYEAHNLLAIVLASSCSPARQLRRAIGEAEAAVALRPKDAAGQRLVAELNLQLGDLAAAQTAINAALALEAHNPDNLRLLASIASRQGRQNDAAAARRTLLQQLQAAISGRQPTVDEYIALGDAQLGVGDTAAALDAYGQAQALAPNDERLQRSMAALYHRQGKANEAIVAYRAWIDRAPDNAEGHLLLGVLLSEQGNQTDALTELQQAAVLNPCDPAPHRYAAGVHLQLLESAALSGDTASQDTAYRDAETELGAALAIEPDSIDIQYVLGSLHFFQERYGDALPFLKSAVDASPPLSQYALAYAYAKTGDATGAQMAFERVITASAATAPSPTLAFAYEYLGRTDEAIATYQSILATQPLSASERSALHTYLGQLLGKQDNASGAQREFEQAIAQDPDNSLAFLSLGTLALGQNDFVTAIDAYEHYVALSPNALTYSTLAMLYSGQSDYDRAIASLQMSIQIDPQNGDYQRELGALSMQLGRLDEAAVALDQAQRLAPDDARVHAQRSTLAYKQCDVATARLEIERATALDPDNAIWRGQLALYDLALGDAQAARSVVDQLIRAGDREYLAHLMAGSTLAVMGNYSGAERELRLVTNNAEAPPIFVAIAAGALADDYLQQEKLDAAQAAAEESLSASPLNAAAQARLGDIALLRADGVAASEIYSATLPLLPAYGQLLGVDSAHLLRPALHLGLALAALVNDDQATTDDELQSALELVEQNLQLTPQWPPLQTLHGHILLASGFNEAAQQAYQTAVACDATLNQEQARFAQWLGAVKGLRQPQ